MGLKKLGKFIKKVIKPVAVIASIVYPPLIPLIGSTLGATTAASAAIIGSAALSAGASAIAGDSTKDIIKNAALAATLTAGANAIRGATAASGAAGATTGVDMAPVGDAANATSSYTGATSAPPPSGMFSAPVMAPSVAPSTTGGEGLFTSSSYTQPIVTSPEGLISPAPSVDVAASIPSITPSVTTTTPSGDGFFTPSNEFMGPIAPTDTGAIDSLMTKAAALTGLSKDTLGKLGVAAVQTLLSTAGAKKIADQQREAAQTQADATIEAARIAAEAAKFRPVGVTTRFGSSNFGYDAQGNLTTAGYTPSAEITGYQDRLRALAGQGMTDIEAARAAYQPLTGAAKSLFSLGESYLSKSPEAVAADYISKQQALISPSRQNQLAELQNKLFQQGRGGAATAQGGSLMATSPEYAAYYNALAQQDLVLAAQADQEARNRITFGSGLFDTGANLQGKYYAGQTAAYQPFATAMDTSKLLESYAAQPLYAGIDIGAKTTASQAEAGRLLSSGITGAAATMLPSNAYSLTGDVLGGISQSPLVTSAIDKAFGVQPQQRTYTVEELKTIFGT